MFIGYNLHLTQDDFTNIKGTYKYYLDRGKAMIKSDKKIFEPKLKEFTNDCKLDGKKLMKNWFPEIEADIFLSHSHRDEDLAIALYAFLKENYNLKVFIDSCFWGYSNDLLKAIDDEYCKNKDSNTYSYERRNSSTSHIHMMLSTALQKMIDKTECLIFLNTENSITSVPEEIRNTTLSPWIYMELETSRTIRLTTRRKINYIETKSIENLYTFSEQQNELLIEYDVKIDHLVPLAPTKLFNLIPTYNLYGLDLLYYHTISGTTIHTKLQETKFIGEE